MSSSLSKVDWLTVRADISIKLIKGLNVGLLGNLSIDLIGLFVSDGLHINKRKKGENRQ